MKKRVLCLLAAAMLWLCGCSVDVESFLRPPRVQGEQQAVQAALETYLRDSGDQGRYTLRYPSEGEYTSAFVLCDSQGFPLKESTAATMAVAFYTPGNNREETHVNLLRRETAGWVSMGDSVGSGTDIRQVAFGDLDGDGVAELLTGWSTYNSQNHQLGIFSMAGELMALSTDRVYTRMQVTDMAGERTSLLLLHIGSGRQVTASLEQLVEGQLTSLDTVRLDGYIQQFGQLTPCQFGSAKGLYIDGVKSAGTTITELVVYEDGGLHAPFYDAVSNQTVVTARATGLSARDVDGDGQVEVPVCTPLPGYTEVSATAMSDWLTTWRAYSYATGRWQDRLQTVVNAVDGYLVTLDTSMVKGVTTRYDSDHHRLELLDKNNQVWMCLHLEDEESAPEENARVVLTGTDEQPDVVVDYDPAVLDEEKVRYMVVRLSFGG